VKSDSESPWFRRALGPLIGLGLCVLAWWQFDWLGADLFAPINHGRNEDWDWQLTFYEACRVALMEYQQAPFWSPWSQGGVPLWANPEFPALYPPFALILWLGTDAGLKLWILLHQFLLVFGGYVAGRQAGLGPVASHGAALAWLCSAFVPGFIQAGHVMYLPMVWLPLAWVAQRRGAWAWAGLCLAMGFLAGGHYLLVYGALWLGMDAVLRGLSPKRLPWLGLALGLNAVLLGWHVLAWPLGVALVVAVAVQRPAGLRLTLPPMVGAGLLAALLLGAKFATAPALFARAERLAPQASLRIADDFDWTTAWSVLIGTVERLSGHEGQNVFWHPAPVVLGLVGLCFLAWRRPAFGVLGLLWWCLGWGGATPVNLLEGLHRLPGFDLLRVVERYSLIWTLFLGWGCGACLDEAWRRAKWLGAAPVLAGLGWWVVVAAPLAAQGQQLGPGRSSQVAPGSFAQTRSELSNYEALQAGQGKIDCWTTAWLEDPAPGLMARGEVGYRGEAWRLEGGEELAVQFSPSRLIVALPEDGTLVINQNAFEGWRVLDGPTEEHEGLIAKRLAAGIYTFSYRPPGLNLGLALSGLGLLVLAGCARLRAPVPLAIENAPRPRKAERVPSSPR
jgi:hypothetical protein